MPTKILAIDDSKTMRLAIKITFAAEDADVTSVSKGSEAVARAKAMGADVVLVDSTLAAGEPSGYDVCRALKQDAATAGIPVIVLVSGQVGVDEGQLAAAGADAWLAKPFDTQELIDKVAAVRGKPVAKPTGAAAAAKPAARPAAAAAPAAADEADASQSGQRARPQNRTQMGMPTPVPKPVSQPVAAAQAAPAAAKPAVAKPAISPGSLAGKPAAATQAPPPSTKPAAAQPTAAAKPAAQPAAAARPAVAAKPAAAAGMARPAAPAGGIAAGGAIPIAIPIPFTAADSPTPGMVERLRHAAAAGGVDPRVAEAIASLSREVIEAIVWEVVPELAESIIRRQSQSA
jgi:CheY-like chemotaxis protein